MTLDLHATPADVMRAVEALQEFGRRQGLGERDIFGLGLALEECATNIVNHALQRDAQRVFQVRIGFTDGCFVIELRDQGPAFDPTTLPERTALPTDDEDRLGGWGIPLVRHYTDEMLYAREAGENILRLRKHVDATASNSTNN